MKTPLIEIPVVAKRGRRHSFLKWAGGKFRILDEIFAALPPGDRLVEPFVGSGVVFMNAGYPRSHLADTNTHLVSALKWVQARPDDVLRELETLFVPGNNREDAYYRLREEFNSDPAPTVRHAAVFIFLNRHCFNGLCRFNRRGAFNVPWGRYQAPQIPRYELLAFHAAAQTATITCAGFAATMAATAPGDVVYGDPPYIPLTDTANFTAYGTEAFGMAEQQQLATLAKETAARGVPVVLSNHDTPFTRELYTGAGAELRFLTVKRSISCVGASRAPANELIAVFR